MDDLGHENTTVMSLEGTFDVPGARVLQNALARMTPGARVLVDFTGVREFNDFAIAVLAQALLDGGAANARVRGLRLHQVRLLRYFGVAPEVFRLEPEPPAR
jgi:anti-anti-sigma regulatory factor